MSVELADILDLWLSEEFPDRRFYITYASITDDHRYVVRLRGKTLCHILDDAIRVRTGSAINDDKYGYPVGWETVQVANPESFVILKRLITARISYITEFTDS